MNKTSIVKEETPNKPLNEIKDKNVLQFSVIRRNGSITPFKSIKISNAIKKAFLAQTKVRSNKDDDIKDEKNIHKTVSNLTNKVVAD